ncbi:MAG: hypothetical protein E7521_00300 [Ruminococcaceae bacterium]|nr:hypothetical protein [Oscillospiraceae bacterium]
MTIIANGMPFIDDKKVIGKWEFFDLIKTRVEFKTDTKNSVTDPIFKEIYFLPNGEKYWIFEGWTKNYLLVHYGGDEPILCYKYSIEEIDNHSFMFLEINGDNNPHIQVFKKVSNKQFKLLEIGRRENVNIPFIFDKKIVGSWVAVDFVENIDDFKGMGPLNKNLWLQNIIFYQNGNVIRKYVDEEWQDKWSKGVLLDLNKLIVSNYVFKTIDDIEFLFLEWKMGNYVFGGMPPSYYVFIRSKK